MISKKWLSVCAAATVGLLAAGCGSSSSGSTSKGGGGASKTSQALKIALVIPVTGTGAIPRIYEDPVKLAVADLKASGTNVSFAIYDAGLTPQQAITATQRALQTKPSVIIGLPVIPQILAVAKMLDQAKVPLLQLSAGDESNYQAGKTGGASEWSFRAGIANSVEATGGAQYMVNKLNLKKLGLMYETADPPDALINSISTVVSAGKATLVAKQGFSYAATDLTEQVLAMKPADGIFNWGYPNTVALGLKQQFQNDIDVPTMTSQSGVTGFLDNLLTDKSQLKKFYSAASCNPQDASNAALYAWGQKFKKAYGFDPDMNSAETYDAVNIAKQAVLAGGSSADVLKRLETQSFTGLCQATYKSDAQHNMGHSTTVIGFATGTPTTVYTYAPPSS